MGCSPAKDRSESFEARKQNQGNKLFLCPQSLNLIEGSSIEGMVLLEITQTTRIQSIHVNVTGKVNTRGNASLVYFLNVTKILYEVPDFVLNPGHYAIPFNLKLPDELPTSFSLTKPNMSCKIGYQLEAFSMLGDRKGMKDVQKFSVSQKVEQEVEEYVADPEKTYNVFDITERGKLLWKIRTSKDTYQFNDRLDIYLDIMNKSSETLRHLNVKLVRNLTLNDNNKPTTIREELLQRDFKVKIKRKCSYVSENAILIGLDLGDVEDKLYQANTTSCKYLTCTYIVEFIYPGNLFKSPKTLFSYQVRFMPKLLSPPKAPVLPSDWRPIFLEPASEVNHTPMVPQVLNIPE
jgi:hypothetical protein